MVSNEDQEAVKAVRKQKKPPPPHNSETQEPHLSPSLPPHTHATPTQAISEAGADILETSTLNDVGVGDLKQKACELLLAHRQETKVRGKKYADIENRIYCATPDARDDRARPAFIPPSVQREKQIKSEGAELPKRRLEKDIEAENGGPGVYSMDMRKNYLLDNDDWKYDQMPEFIEGKNVMDFIDPDIDQRLAELEAEEEARLEEEAARAMELAKDPGFKLTEESKEALVMVNRKIAEIRMENDMKKARGRGKLGRVSEAVTRHQDGVHKDRTEEGRGRKRKRDFDEDGEEILTELEENRTLEERTRSSSTLRSNCRTRFFSASPASRDRGVSVGKLDGLKSGHQKVRALMMSRKKTRVLSRYAFTRKHEKVKRRRRSTTQRNNTQQGLSYGRVGPSPLRLEAEVGLHRQDEDQRQEGPPLSTVSEIQRREQPHHHTHSNTTHNPTLTPVFASCRCCNLCVSPVSEPHQCERVCIPHCGVGKRGALPAGECATEAIRTEHSTAQHSTAQQRPGTRKGRRRRRSLATNHFLPPSCYYFYHAPPQSAHFPLLFPPIKNSPLPHPPLSPPPLPSRFTAAPSLPRSLPALALIRQSQQPPFVPSRRKHVARTQTSPASPYLPCLLTARPRQLCSIYLRLLLSRRRCRAACTTQQWMRRALRKSC